MPGHPSPERAGDRSGSGEPPGVRRKPTGGSEGLVMNARRWLAVPVVPLLAWVLLAPARAEGPAVRTVEFTSPSVGRAMKYNVALPPDYETSERRYPVVYLLHGFTSDYTAWAALGAPRAAQPYGMIVVMPDAGN